MLFAIALLITFIAGWFMAGGNRPRAVVYQHVIRPMGYFGARGEHIITRLSHPALDYYGKPHEWLMWSLGGIDHPEVFAFPVHPETFQVTDWTEMPFSQSRVSEIDDVVHDAGYDLHLVGTVNQVWQDTDRVRFDRYIERTVPWNSTLNHLMVLDFLATLEAGEFSSYTED